MRYIIITFQWPLLRVCLSLNHLFLLKKSSASYECSLKSCTYFSNGITSLRAIWLLVAILGNIWLEHDCSFDIATWRMFDLSTIVHLIFLPQAFYDPREAELLPASAGDPPRLAGSSGPDFSEVTACALGSCQTFCVTSKSRVSGFPQAIKPHWPSKPNVLGTSDLASDVGLELLLLWENWSPTQRVRDFTILQVWLLPTCWLSSLCLWMCNYFW